MADANLVDTDLTGADLPGADLRGARFGTTVLRDVDLRGARVDGLRSAAVRPAGRAHRLSSRRCCSRPRSASSSADDVSSWHRASVPTNRAPGRMCERDGEDPRRQGHPGQRSRPSSSRASRRSPSAASSPASAPSWSATTRAAAGTSTPSTRTAPRSASPASGATCRPAPPRPRSRPSSTSSTPTRRAPRSSSSSRPGSTRTRSSPASTRSRTSTGCTRPTSAGSCSASRRRCRARRPAIIELLRRYDVPIAGAHVVIVGRGITVGRPLGADAHPAQRERHRHACATPARATWPRTSAQADIVVAAAGSAGLITADMVKPGAAVLDAGVSRVDGKIAGDVAAGRRRGRRLAQPQPRRGRADDPGDAAEQRGRGRRARAA